MEVHLEETIKECQNSTSLKTLEINLKTLKQALLDGKNASKIEIIESYMRNILFDRKKKKLSSDFFRKDGSEIYSIFLEILNLFENKLYILDRFLEFFEIDSSLNNNNKNKENEQNLEQICFLSNIFCEFILGSNFKIIISSILQLNNDQIIENQMNRILKLPLIFSNFAKSMSKIFDKEKYYEILFDCLQDFEEDKNDLLIFIINKLAFNGILGKNFSQASLNLKRNIFPKYI